jgi:hypothetical protein
VTDMPPPPPTSGHSHTNSEHSWDDSEGNASESSSSISPKSKPKHLKSHSWGSPSVREGYREARHFAGGIIHHPSESTEHYSILRHSHGLVFYQGISTSVAISVFADRALPHNRTFWLKPRSWSGTAKNRATFRQQTDELIDITPTLEVRSNQLDPNHERAWQRDIMQFERRTIRGARSSHYLRETVVARIPAEAGDGYFQIVLCAGEREETLCISPVFRVLSVSSSMGGVSGANWATLPLELGAMALSMQAQKKVGAAIIPVKMAAKSKTQSYIPSHAGDAKKVGMLAYGATGAADKVAGQIHNFNQKHEKERENPFTPAFKIDDDYDHGPKHPYPIRFKARCDHDIGIMSKSHIMPMTRLVGVPEMATYKLWGYYFGWCSPPPERVETNGRVKVLHHWLQAVIVVSPVDVDSLDQVSIFRANLPVVRIQILGNSHERLPNNAEVIVEVLGCIRPWDQELESLLAEDEKAGEEIAFETALINEMSDISFAQDILDRPEWSPEALAQKERDAERKHKAHGHGMERVKQEYTEKRLAVQKKIDQVPLHKVGVRMPADKIKDKSVVINGYFIERC